MTIPQPGDRIHNWKIVSIDGRRATAQCRCGQVRVIAIEALQSGAQTSCGCTNSFAPKKQARQEAQQERRRQQFFDWRPQRGR